MRREKMERQFFGSAMYGGYPGYGMGYGGHPFYHHHHHYGYGGYPFHHHHHGFGGYPPYQQQPWFGYRNDFVIPTC